MGITLRSIYANGYVITDAARSVTPQYLLRCGLVVSSPLWAAPLPADLILQTANLVKNWGSPNWRSIHKKQTQAIIFRHSGIRHNLSRFRKMVGFILFVHNKKTTLTGGFFVVT